MKYALVATCSLGLEAVVARELQSLGCEEINSSNGQVAFQGDENTLCRANLWLRSADRVWMEVGSFPAATFEELYLGTKALHWEYYFPGNASFPVDAHTHNSALTSLPAIQRTVKKAIVESMQLRYRRQWLPEDGAVFPVRAFLVNDTCKMLLDTSGSGLHRRGYHTLNTAAPLRETLAAALVQLSYWNKERLLLDPFCGSGTIAIEAALLGLNRAPGLNREFVSMYWPMIGAKVWQEAKQEAEDVFDRHTTLKITASDNNPAVLHIAKAHLRAAGLEGRGIEVQCLDVKDCHPQEEYGVLITNPPYGERLLDNEQAQELFATLGQLCRTLDTWSYYIICSNPAFPTAFGAAPQRKRKVYNALMACTYYQYLGPKPPRPV